MSLTIINKHYGSKEIIKGKPRKQKRNLLRDRTNRSISLHIPCFRVESRREDGRRLHSNKHGRTVGRRNHTRYTTDATSSSATTSRTSVNDLIQIVDEEINLDDNLDIMDVEANVANHGVYDFSGTGNGYEGEYGYGDEYSGESEVFAVVEEMPKFPGGNVQNGFPSTSNIR